MSIDTTLGRYDLKTPSDTEPRSLRDIFLRTLQHECAPKPTTPLPILAEASSIIHGARNESYGDHEREAERIAAYWNTHLGDKLNDALTPDDVDIMMILLKVSREGHKHKRDNLVDLCGYAALMQERYDAAGDFS